MKNTLLLSALTSASLVMLGCHSASELHTPAKENKEVTQTAKFSGQVATDPKILKGKLDNGIKFLIRKNNEPEKRAEIRLVLNAGSVLEDDNQQGFAHFVEHMAFNGTKDFKKHEIIEYVESIGMTFGAHLNAHTSFDETVYKLQLPTDEMATLEKGIHILENWAHKISFEPEEIDKERGVVIEEMRTRQGARTRIMYKQLPVLFKDSRYAQRLPIGTKEVLAHGSHEDLIRYYKEWYRPELMSLIAVGDFEPSEVKALFEKYFSAIKPTQAHYRARAQFTIPENNEPLISIETDPELTNTIVSVSVKQPLFQPQSYQEHRQALVHQLFIGMLNNRYDENTLKPDASVINSGANFSQVFGDISSFSAYAAAKPKQSKAALAFLLTELNRVVQHGFTASEFKRQKANILNRYEKLAKEANNLNSRQLAEEYVRHFMNHETVPGVEHEYEIAEHFIPSITLNEVNALAHKWLSDKNRLISISAPDSDKNTLPEKAEALAIWQQIETSTLTAYQDENVAEQLLTALPTAGSVVDKQYLDDIDSHLWTLSNGVNVLLKKTDFKDDSILFNARANGGTSNLDPQTIEKTLFATFLTDMMGMGDFSFTDLNKFMQGKSFQLKADIGKYEHTLKGNSSVKDLEHFMQMLHLRFQYPRIDEQAFNTNIARLASYYENKFNSPSGVFEEAIRLKQYADDPRSIKIDADNIKKIDLKTSVDVFHQRFNNAANFNFVFVGNIDFENMEKYLSTYLASLPTNLAKETWRKTPDKRTKGELTLTVNKGLEAKANVKMKIYGEQTWSFEQEQKFNTLVGVVNTLLRERIREEKSGVYGVRVSGKLSRKFDNYKLDINFSCDPERADELITEIKTVFNEIKATPVEAKYVDNYIAQQLKKLEVGKKANGFWLNYLTWLAEPEFAPQPMTEKEALIKSITPADTHVAAQVYLNFNDSLIAKLMPEKSAEKK